MKLKFKSLSLLLAVVLFFGITLTPTTTNAAIKNKIMNVSLIAPNDGSTYSRFNSSKTSKDFIGKASEPSLALMTTIFDTQRVYYNDNKRTTNYIRRVNSTGSVEKYFEFTVNEEVFENNTNMRIKFDILGNLVYVAFF